VAEHRESPIKIQLKYLLIGNTVRGNHQPEAYLEFHCSFARPKSGFSKGFGTAPTWHLIEIELQAMALMHMHAYASAIKF
jgi:hypothetical protein